MCGIVGIFSHGPVAAEIHDSLIHLQHRGQDAAGILTCNERFYLKHGLGLVREIFSSQDIVQLHGSVGIGHTRYPTAGGNSLSDVQPLWIGSPRGIALAHNGNLVNYEALAHEITKEKHRHLNSSIDSEVFLHLIADSLEERNPLEENEDSFFKQICHAVKQIFIKAQGSYSIVGIIIGKGMLAFRDPHGIRPLVLGERKNINGTKDYIIASETTMFYALGFEPKGDIAPGEVVFVNNDGKLFRKVLEQREFSPCVFEYVYFARPDATINDVSVYRSRLHMGQNLAKHWKEKFPHELPDVVIPAPFTSNTAALSFAHELGVRYSEGLYKNPFIGRTFIMPDKKERSRSVRYKLTPQKTEINDKKVLILDDSIVRGTTCREIVKMVREFGAKEIYFASACPPIKNPCFYGVDIPSRSELIAANASLDEIREYLGVDKLLYQTLDDLVEAISRRGANHMQKPCMACMNGCYVTGNMTEDKIKLLGDLRCQNILVIGCGAREHAIVNALNRSAQQPRIHCFGGYCNPGIAAIVVEYGIGDIAAIHSIIKKAQEWKIDFVIIGPEAPLENGLADAFWQQNIPVIGPKQNLARLETSKAFTRELLNKYQIAGSPAYRIFHALSGVKHFLQELGEGNYVIKANGLMGGKGVKVAGDHLHSIAEAYQFCEELSLQGQSFVIEEKLIGQEFSVLCFCDGQTLIPMPLVQDHKRAFINDEGPNTGGMGSYSDANHLLPFLNDDDLHAAQEINKAVIKALSIECNDKYIGILYGSFMITKDGIRLIEYNARFGDPEVMNVLAILESDFVEICQAMLTEKLSEISVNFSKLATVCKYAVPMGYPDQPEKNFTIDVTNVVNREQLYFGAVNKIDNNLYATGSRTVAVVGVAPTIYAAEKIAEVEISRVQGNLFHREDIGTAALIQHKIKQVIELRSCVA